MNIGIKYCGGCNSTYDRVKLVETIFSKYDSHTYEYAAKDKNYDLIILVCGCSSVCVDMAEYLYNEIITISSEDQINELDKLLN